MDFLKFFFQIGLVGKFVLAFLLGMSLISWYYIFYNIFYFRGFKNLLENWRYKLENLREITSLLKEVKGGEDELARTFKRFMVKFAEVYDFYFGERAKIEAPKEDIKEEAQKDLEEYAEIEKEKKLLEMGRGLGFLATTANTAPFIGLFGTVWGIMRAFHEIGLKGSASLATVAPGIAEALINTALGLLVAIPASLAYNYFLLKKEKLGKELELLFKGVLILARRQMLK